MLPIRMSNASITDLTTTQLRRAVAIKEQIESLESELSAMLGGPQANAKRRGRPKKASRDSDVAAKLEASSKEPAKKRRKFSAAARAKMRNAAKARWAAAKAKGKSTL